MTKKAFTLVELMVVVTVLSILASIGFVSYLGYSQDSRDGIRISNLNDIKKSLELKKSSSGGFPIPDNSYSVKYLGKEVWKQGIIGSKTKKHIKYSSIDMDPKYDTDYSYSVSSNGKRFEVGTIMEDGENNPMGFFLGNTYANTSDKALTFGNLKGKFHVTKVNGETHVFSIPGMIFNDSSELNIVVDQPTTQFAVSGEGSLPETYVGKSEANEEIIFTSKLLYRGSNCGVETDQEIVNFLASLRDSFNYEPFLSNPEYQDIFNDYNTLRNNLDDFDTLKKLGLKINKLLDCNIKSFKTVDIFPTQCGYEGLAFEGVADNYDIATESCLFDYQGVGVATVQSGLGVSNTKGLYIDPIHGTGEFSYRVFTYQPVKFNFEYLPNFSSSSNLKFYINDVEYKYMNGSSVDYDNLSFKTFQTPLLKPGLYDFKWVVYKYGSYSHHGEVILDNLNFTCVGGGNGCGWTDNEFEVGPLNPWDIFEFSGGIQSTWEQVDRGNGTLAIKSPPLGINAESFITKTVTLEEPAKIEFDMMTDLSGNGSVKFYIDGIEMLNLWGNGGIYEDNYDVYSTPLLPAGTYELKWRVDRYTWYTAVMWLDQLRLACEGGADVIGNEGCGWQNDTFEDGDINPWETLDFSGTLESYHWKQVERDTGGEAITNMLIHGNGKTSISKELILTEPAKINFDLMADLNGAGSVTFYINDNQLLRLYGDAGEYKDDYKKFTTELLPAGTYTLRWDIDRYTYYKAYMWFDNFHLSCEGGATIPGNETCGWANETFEKGTINPWDNLIIEGDLESYEWIQTPNGDGTYSIRNNIPSHSGLATLKKSYTFAESAKFNFDLKTDFNSASHVKFYINDIEYLYTRSNNGEYDENFKKFTTPLLPAGTYEFKWEIKRYYGDYRTYMWLDNLEKSCIGGGGLCGWTEKTFEPGPINPWDYLSFSGALESYQWVQEDMGSGSYAITNKILPHNGSATFKKIYTFTDSAKFNFDLKFKDNSSSYLKFYIDGVEYYSTRGRYGEHNNIFKTYTTPLLPAGTYEFKWELKKSYNDSYAYIWLDNFEKSCIGGAGLCGWTEKTFEPGLINPWDYLTFSGALKSYQWSQVDTGTGNYAITNMVLPHNGKSILKKIYTFTDSTEFSFDLKFKDNSSSYLRFYIDGVEKYSTRGRYGEHNNVFKTYTNPILPAGTYEFEWELEKHYSDGNAYIWLDNLTH